MNLNLLPDEHSIKESMDKSVCLTSHRLCAEHKELGRSYTQSVLLENINATSLQRVSHASYLFMGVALASGVLLFGSSEGAETFIIAAAVLVFFTLRYLLSRKTSIHVVSTDSQMQINVTQMPQDSVLRFLQDIEEAKNNRVQALRNATIA